MFLGCSFDLIEHVAAQLDSDAIAAKQYQAVRLFEQGNLGGAIEFLDNSIQQFPDSSALYLIRGTIFRKSGDYTKSISDFDRAIQLDPSSADAHCQRGFAYQQSETIDWDDNALADSTNAIQLDPTSSLAHIVRGNAYVERQDYERAISDFTRAIELNPSSYSAYGNRATASLNIGNVSQARQDIAMALSFDPPLGDREALEAISEQLGQDSDRTQPTGLFK